ncbi:unnamed protein product [Paramecium sonneborni]|uniref:Uncharacterized protein n=1 Tax=Paramecium sonneborni TaxID=65129 RepID=A0A8S1NCH9_9CILI|nr:unnamed protein product [Paramecium sonneborni]
MYQLWYIVSGFVGYLLYDGISKIIKEFLIQSLEVVKLKLRSLKQWLKQLHLHLFMVLLMYQLHQQLNLIQEGYKKQFFILFSFSVVLEFFDYQNIYVSAQNTSYVFLMKL